jgi:hypothetical protein
MIAASFLLAIKVAVLDQAGFGTRRYGPGCRFPHFARSP